MKAKVRLRVEVGDSGFDSTMGMSVENSERMTKLFNEILAHEYPATRSRAEASGEGGAVPPSSHRAGDGAERKP